jgi:hypothetical protein
LRKKIKEILCIVLESSKVNLTNIKKEKLKMNEQEKKRIMEERAKQSFTDSLNDDSTIHDDIRTAVEEVLGQNANADTLITVISELIINEYGDN